MKIDEVYAASRILVAVDPGIRGCGVAVFRGPTLVKAAYVENPCREGNRAAEAATMASWVRGAADAGDPVSEVAVEWPQVYARQIRSGSSAGDPNDLTPLAGVVSAVALAFFPAKCSSYLPAEWKGQMTKEACRVRVAMRLSPEEHALVDGSATRSKVHNVWDAVGVGLHHLGRFERRRVIPT